jgi:hypothetical protein
MFACALLTFLITCYTQFNDYCLKIKQTTVRFLCNLFDSFVQVLVRCLSSRQRTVGGIDMFQGMDWLVLMLPVDWHLQKSL